MASSQEGWTDICAEGGSLQPESAPLASPLDGPAYSIVLSPSEMDSGEIIVHADRELRLKLFWVQVSSMMNYRYITVSN